MKQIRFWLLVGLLFVAGFVHGCSTIHGFGADLQDWTENNVNASK